MNSRSYFGLFLIVFFYSFCSRRNEHGGVIEKRTNDSGIVYASHFTLEKGDGCTILSITDPWQGASGIGHIYYLVRRDAPLPAGISASDVIRVPVRRIISMSTTYLSMIKELGAESTVVGLSGSDLVFNEGFYERVKKGEIAEVGYEDNLNKELVITLAPDLIMVYGVGSESSGYLSKLDELGIKVMFNADYLENDPLGKAEWIKVFGALYCREKEADEIFLKVAEQYNGIKEYIGTSVTARPKVLLGLPWKDTWYVSPGNSFVSILISDAGGDYLWKDTRSETSMPYGVENVWVKALEADYWLNTGTVFRRDEIVQFDHRLKELPCVRKGSLFNNNNRVTERGGNDYWESGSCKPHVILKDIASILHPDLFPDYALFYYRKVD